MITSPSTRPGPQAIAEGGGASKSTFLELLARTVQAAPAGSTSKAAARTPDVAHEAGITATGVKRESRLPGYLREAEYYWRDRQQWLEAQGYMLRPRYRPDWKPSWEGTKKSWFDCEDGTGFGVSHLVDATRIRDGKLVMLKQISKSVHPYEADICQFFASEPLASDSRNHCVLLIEVLQDPEDDNIHILVMPFLRPHNDPPFQTVGEIVEFFRQIFEGLHFMHQHRVAHRDCMVMNIMMDPEPMFPNLYHPIFTDEKRDLSGKARYYSRTERPTKYYLIDFGLSRKYNADNLSPRELPIIGGDKTVPEFQGEKYDEASDPFPTDVYYVGNMIRQYYLQSYMGLDFMDVLIANMTEADPAKRPTMLEVEKRFEVIRSALTSRTLRRRLVGREEHAMSRLFFDTKHFIISAGYIVRRLPAVPRPVARKS
ncbi:hypothetical protein OBBRIDRAFT_735113 [Obba rivulosa]|uniref:Protein kinase domain-containing protein n=1 Tax=Obba rivulosa TaxID=1052685 RepID=A0A8E2DHE5_9APHY|nr:hypothetical protein OBBRIDRAFT_735113 [Obba rivulosa]